MHTYYSTYTHPTHTNCSVWSLISQSVRFTVTKQRRILSHQPTVNESLSIDISWQRLNGLTAQRLQTKWTPAPVTNGQKMFRKWAAKGLRVFLIRCVLSLHFPMSAAYLLTYQVLVLDANAVPYWPPWVPCDWRTLSSAFWWEKK